MSKLLALILMGAASAQAPPSSKPTYDDLAKRVRTGDLSVDFQELRFACADSENCSFDPDLRTAMYQQLRQKSYEKVVETAEKLLAKNIADMDAHFGAMIAHKQLGHPEKSQYHNEVLRGLFQSLHKDGADGKSTATAMKVIAVDEEYAYMRLIGLRPAQQSLLSSDGHSYDQMKMKDEKEGDVTLYFNVDIPEQKLAKALGEVDKPKRKKN